MLHLPAAGIGFAFLTSAWLAGCGSGVVGISGLGGGDGGGNAPPSVGDIALGGATDLAASPVAFSFRLTDAEGNPASVSVSYVPLGGVATPALLVGNTNLTGLSTGTPGVVHTRQWDFAAQLGTGNSFDAGYRLVVQIVGQATGVESELFDVGNDAAEITDILVPGDQAGGIAAISLNCADSSDDTVTIVVEYDNLDDASGWQTATSVGPGLTNIAATAEGVPLLFFWDVENDQPDRDFEVQLRLTTNDGKVIGLPVVSPSFTIDGNSPPVAVLNGGAFIATPDQRRGIPVPLEVFDDEDDPIRLVFQWRRPFETFPTLPITNEAIDLILASDDLRRAHHIATERPVIQRGRLSPVDSVTVRCAKLAKSAIGLSVPTLIGRDIELLRESIVPTPVASSWSANPLVTPVAALGWRDGPTALVLDSQSAGTWRLREIDLATGSVVRQIADAGNGDPSALAYLPGSSQVLVACDSAGVWSLVEVDARTGAVTPWITTSGANAFGSIRGLAPKSSRTCLLTVDTMLVSIDANSLAAPTESVLVRGLQGPSGIALNPTRTDRLYLAERDWVNPATSTLEGRLLVVDLATLSATRIVTSGTALRRPDSIAFERDSQRIVVTTDQNVLDGQRELCAAEIGQTASPAWVVTASLSDGTRSVSTGCEGLRIVTLGTSHDLAVGGGVEQVRAISQFDAARCEATVADSFQPLPRALQPWRIVDTVNGVHATSDVFVWDSSDLGGGGSVVLRAVPYDTTQGLPTDTGIPRDVRAAIDVRATVIGGPATTTGASALAVGDLDGNGTRDLVSANVGSDTLTVFFNSGPGNLPVNPNVTLTGTAILAPMTDPVAVVVIDADGDGDLDIISANRGSNNSTVFRQTAPGTFTLQIPSLASGSSAPTDVAAGDLNGDGLTDIVRANSGTHNLHVFFQLGGGLYPLGPSATLSTGGFSAPSGVSVGDLDGDGDLDIAASNAGSNNVVAFFQGAAGVFPATPSMTLGGLGLTDGPRDIAIGDVDSDGDKDIAVANATGNDLAVFVQSAPGGFGVTPTFTLASSDGPFQPVGVAITDLSDGTADLVATSVDGSLIVYLYDTELEAYAPEPLRIDAEGVLSNPVSVVTDDLDGDGLTDLAVADSDSDDIVILFQRGAGSFSSAPDATFGSSIDTDGPSAVAVADLDGDSDFDIVCANELTGDLATYIQFSPAVLSSTPQQRFGSGTTTAQVRAIQAADFDGDGLVDLATANQGTGTVTIFFQLPDRTYPATPGVTLTTLSAPCALAVADLDGDGDFDLACANKGANNVRVFFQTAPRTFTAPGLTLGGAGSTGGVSAVVAADLDADGDVDLACANETSNTIAVFKQSAPGTYPASPNLSLGSGALTPAACALAVGDIDGDGWLDLACASRSGDRVVLFRQDAPGSFVASPAATVIHALLDQPTSIALADSDQDGDLDLFAGADTSQNVCLFTQLRPWVFSAAPDVIGGPSETGVPRTPCAIDFDGDGDLDLVLARPALDSVAIFYSSH
jgi:hypothetical protein